MLALVCSTSIRAQSDSLFRANAPKFHRNFSAGQFAKNGALVTEDIDVNSNNVQLVGRDNFITRIERYSIPFPGLQLRDRVIIVDGNVAAVNYILQGAQTGPYGTIAPTGNKVEAMSGEVFEFTPQGLMKKLTTITELDRLKAEINGAVKVDAFQTVVLLPNGKVSPEHRAMVKAAAAMFHKNFNEGHVERNADLAVEGIRINADDDLLQGRSALVQRLQRLKVAFPDMTIHDEYVLADGNRAAVEYVMEGTQAGSGKTVRVRGIDFMEFDSAGRLEELTVVHNEDDFVMQLQR
jgi:predicted ester cyclase